MAESTARPHRHPDAAREIVAHVQRWAPFEGGGDEEILPTFGVTPRVFYVRALEYLRTNPQLVGAHERDALMAYCTRKSQPARHSA